MVFSMRLLIASLFSISSALMGMEKSIEIKNWDYKERDRGCLGYFLPKQNNPKEYPYFLPEKDNSESKRSFSDDLLAVQKMESDGLPKDVTNQILYKVYLAEKTLDPDKMREIKDKFNVSEFDFLCLPMEK